MTKTKEQLRAEAVERLNGMVLDTGSAVKKLAIALDVKWNPDNAPASISALQNRLRDLLTDSHESRESYEERLYEVPVSDCPYCGCARVVIHDYETMYEHPHSYRVEHVSEKESFNAGCFESYYAFDSIEKAVEHANMRDDCGQITDMSQKGADCVREEPEMSEMREKTDPETPEFVENPQKSAFHGRKDTQFDSREKKVNMPYHNGEKQAKLLGKEYDQVVIDELRIEEPDTIRNELMDNGCLTHDSDSREKLEADAIAYCDHFQCTRQRFNEEKLLALLDRQASITEREYIHSHPICGGSDTCHATNLLNSESVERETPQTAENATSKDEIRDFDVWSVAYEIYCAGGWVDNGNEPNPPTDGIWKLLDRQAEITADKIQHDAAIASREAGKVLRDEIAAWKSRAEKLQSQLECAQDVNERQDAEYVRLKAELESKNAQLDEIARCGTADAALNEKLAGERDELQKKVDNQKKELARLNAENAHLRYSIDFPDDVLYNGGGAKDWYDSYMEAYGLIEGLERRNVALVDQVKQAKDEILQYAQDCGECSTAMPEGVSWPRWSDGSLVEFGQKLAGMRVKEVSFKADSFQVLGGEMFPFTLARDSYGTTYERDGKRDEGMA